ncbi:MAG: 30S ribosomal protein S4 [Spirochaetales bacterium]|nr:30S ribosomal protein S4 [Spirochaetales bacterium]
MAIYRAPVLKRCQYLGLNPLVLGYSTKPSKRRQRVRRRKQSEYARQLIEKQKVRFVYGVLERQFKLTYDRAEKMAGVTGENLLQLLEQRFDNVIFRLGLASTRPQARQWINHGHFTLNGRRVNIPSVTLKMGDKIGVKEASKGVIRQAKMANQRTLPRWLSLDEDKLEATLVALPSRQDIDFEVAESAIVELYSK